jgi:hypothetical protein
VPVGTYTSTSKALGVNLTLLYNNKGLYQTESNLALTRVRTYLAWDAKGEVMNQAYASLG